MTRTRLDLMTKAGPIGEEVSTWEAETQVFKTLPRIMEPGGCGSVV
jgi:hypothetical protein